MSARPTLKITGIGVAYPPTLVPAEELEKTAYELYKHSPALDKTMAINRSSGVKTRSLAVPCSSPIFNQATVPTINTISEIFAKEGVALAVSAARLAIEEAGIKPSEITHVVSTTCTTSSNPGYDVLLAAEIGLDPAVESVLLHGVGCSGGLAAIRLATSLCHTAAWRGRGANVLVVACEICSTGWRNGLELIDREQRVRVGLTLFGDGAGALVLSLDDGLPGEAGTEAEAQEKGIFEIVATTHVLLPGTQDLLRFDVSPEGWKETISPRLPEVITSVLPSLYKGVLAAAPDDIVPTFPSNPTDFDWPVHTGGTSILRSIEKAMGIGKEHTKASWEVYQNQGNTSSSSVLCVLDMSRRIQGREWCISVGFGPGLCGEALLLRRIRRT